MMKTLDEVIKIVSKREGALNKDISHYLMMYRYPLRDQAAAEEAARQQKKGGIMSKVIHGMPEKRRG